MSKIKVFVFAVIFFLFILSFFGKSVVGLKNYIYDRFSFSGHRVMRNFRESLVKLSATEGDILEVAILQVDETLSRVDMKSLFNDLVYLGTTISEIKVPAIYRYHIKLSDDWTISVRDHLCVVVAPPVRPTLPPAFRSENMEKRSNAGWLRFNADENLELLEKSITPTLERLASDQEKIILVREPARKAVAQFVQKWLLTQDQWKKEAIHSIQVLWPDEIRNKSAEKVPVTLTF